MSRPSLRPDRVITVWELDREIWHKEGRPVFVDAASLRMLRVR